MYVSHAMELENNNDMDPARDPRVRWHGRSGAVWHAPAWFSQVPCAFEETPGRAPASRVSS
eukprot:CAMPEP_0181241950 /NCGR_PEP_ID=MMETSP1096-20121128/41406_1 /TAXON_ID=156174 ORGANISM="Chrysochromulina ericina, Strain CCMP281" /NCGR_SAMPLE_ID=MMETSP1096 /ASSEMBLY_ACC=CAM_ASM_000453 /LENGTH=60 /DNA_ID=CAMNT_0023338079 /DNA_START=66 /DNA_END=245 /DNA_ORIENTATION=+